jgi:hypothetical protein
MKWEMSAAAVYNVCHTTEAEFLDEIQTKVLRVFLLAIHSHLYSFALRFPSLQTRNLLQFLLCVTVL